MRRLKNSLRARKAGAAARQRTLAKRLQSLEKDAGYPALVLAALIERLDEKGVLARAEIRSALAELDEVDGVKDGRLDINLLRELDG